MSIDKEIIQILEEKKHLPAVIAERTNLYFDLGIDSLSFISLLLQIEEKYSITIDITEMESCLQVKPLITLIESKVKEARQNS